MHQFSYTGVTDEQILELGWRAKIQVLAIQMDEYLSVTSEFEKKVWKPKILNTLCSVNQQAQLFNPSEMPKNLRPASSVRVLQGEDWLDGLTLQLKQVFLSQEKI